MKTGILTFEQFQGKKDIGSSRIRGHWIVKHWINAGPDIGPAEIYRYGAEYSAVIYQKAYFVEHARAFTGVKIFDLCDPDWLHWSYRTKEMLNEVDAVTCSSQALVEAVKKFTDKPVYLIPDRVDMSQVPSPKIHVGPTKTAVWFGYSHNFPILDSTIQGLSRRKLSLIVISEGIYAQPSAFNIEVTNLPFSSNFMSDIQRGDILINPRHTKGKWKYKSENKTYIAWGLGMPVAHNAEELDQLMTEPARIAESALRLKEVNEKYRVEESVKEFKKIITDIAKNKVI